MRGEGKRKRPKGTETQADDWLQEFCRDTHQMVSRGDKDHGHL